MPSILSGSRGIEFTETLGGSHWILHNTGTLFLAGAISGRFDQLPDAADEKIIILNPLYYDTYYRRDRVLVAKGR